jgi:4'-phosphopantetheinyl transferase
MTIVYHSLSTSFLTEKEFAAHVSLLPQDLRSRVLQFRRRQDRYASLLGKLLLTKAIEAFGLTWTLADLCYTPHQRPAFPSASFDFNISHSGDCIVCAASDEVRLGIDVEYIRPLDISEFKAQCHEKEWSELVRSALSADAFLGIWTKKEALIKADGRGLSLPLSGINVLDTAGSAVVDGRTWIITEIELPGPYKCALATSAVTDFFTQSIASYAQTKIPEAQRGL